MEALSAGVAVVGAGPAGMTAAGRAASSGADVLLLEGGDKPGRKLVLTGRKRCNLTNTLPLDEFLQAYGRNGRFLRNAYSRFFSAELAAFLSEIGVDTARERGGRIYPVRGGAEGVRRALRAYAESAGTRIRVNRRVRRLTRKDDGTFLLGGDSFRVKAVRVILATGGASWPQTGSRGDGYALARSLGHTVETLHPALVPLRCAEGFLPRLKGLRLRNVRLSYCRRGKKRSEFFGEVHFTDFGISGPAVFPASGEIGKLAAKGPLEVKVNLKPALERSTLEARLLREFSSGGAEALSTVLERLLPRQLVPVFLERAGAAAGLPAAETPRATRKSILSLLQAFPLTVTGTLPLERGMVTAGGVRLTEVDPATMESRIVPGLYFCGELLDIDGTTGGFNLQAAFSTGTLAGEAAGRGQRP
jgi:predicted Rossmann fold flavoprotein